MRIYTLLIITIVCFASCKKDDINTNNTASLEFSQDTIIFDTIFTSIGSITKQLMVYNNNNFDITTNIELAENSNGNFRMNVDGEPGKKIENVLIRSNDSIFIFLEVTIDPTNTNTPYLVLDSIMFTTGSNKQNVDLVAYGQDARFYTPNTYGNWQHPNDTSKFFYYHEITQNQTWDNIKPHVIYGIISINPSTELTIAAGTNIYLHKDAMIIVRGTIKTEGSLGNEITFQGDRLDSWYDSLPGQWNKVWLYPGSINNEFNYTNFRNGTIAIHADTIGNSNATAIINNCRIDNMSSIGILGQGTNIEVNNSIITKCGQYAVVCNLGGSYKFNHCTFANYWNYTNRNTPSILLNNYYEGSNGEIYARDLNNAYFGNCIIDGYLTNEISLQQNIDALFNYTFDHCLIKINPNEININDPNYINIISKEDPGFVNKTLFDFHLNQNSVCKSSGDIIITQSNYNLHIDIEGNIRNNPPDIGALNSIN